MRQTLVLVGALWLAGCGRPSSEVERLSEEFVYQSLAMSPVSASAAGYQRHAGVQLNRELDDLSAAGLERRRNFYAGFRSRFDELARRPRVDTQDQADLELIRNNIELALLELDTIQDWRHNPTVYVELIGSSLFAPYTLEYAPKTRRFRDIVARIQKIPVVLDQARANLVDAPEIWNEVAQEENEGNIALIDVTLRRDCPEEVRAEFDRAAAGAIGSLRDFNTWLRTELVHRTTDWRLGREKYALKLKYALGTDKSPEQILAEAEAELKATRERMAAIAQGETVEAALDRIARDHATPQTYMEAARRDLEEASAFVRDQKLLSLPARSNLQVIATPDFMRGIYSVGGFNPAPALQPALGAFYWLTPVPERWPKERIESKLREYNKYGLKILTVHEAMPGHYVQAEYANDVQPQVRRLVRSLYGNMPYIEGWAVYATQMMIESGYYRDDPGMQLTWGKQLLRAIANTILDIRLQTMGMTDQQALDLMIRDTYQEGEEAAGKLRRAKLSSAQLPTYFTGWRDWLSVRDAYRSRRGSRYNMAEFHERALGAGAVTMPSLSRLLSAE
jgi:uncharacterized protein (DUF885 family)